MIQADLKKIAIGCLVLSLLLTTFVALWRPKCSRGREDGRKVETSDAEKQQLQNESGDYRQKEAEEEQETTKRIIEISTTHSTERKILEKMLKSVDGVPGAGLLDCEQMLFLRDSQTHGDGELTLRRKSVRMSNDVTQETWTVVSIKRQVSFMFQQSKSKYFYRKLRAELSKRARHHLAEVNKLRGSCVDEARGYVMILTDHDPEAKPLCGPKRILNFATDPCFQLQKLKNTLMTSSPGESPVLKTLRFFRSFVCTIDHLQNENLFLEDLVGFLVTPDFQLRLTSMEGVIHYGNSNVYGGTVCLEDKHCAFPVGSKWASGSPNQYFYQTCFNKNTCIDNKCAGFNATLHVCALQRWIVPSLLHQVRRLGDDLAIRNKFDRIVREIDSRTQDKSAILPRHNDTPAVLCNMATDLLDEITSTPK